MRWQLGSFMNSVSVLSSRPGVSICISSLAITMATVKEPASFIFSSSYVVRVPVSSWTQMLKKKKKKKRKVTLCHEIINFNKI